MRRLLVLLTAGLLVAAATACEPQINPELAPGATAKAFGASTSPWDVDDWAASVGAKPTSVLMFEQFSLNRDLDKHFKEAKRQGLGSVTLSWEPWTSVPASAGQAAQYAPQPRWSNASIANGSHDAYIRTMATSVKNSGLKVWMRWGHEMNGDWYPWSHDPANFVQAWRRIVDIFRATGASNARFVWSVNPSLYQDDTKFKAGVAPYWPGSGYVHALGTTMIDFGGTKDYPVARFVARFKVLRSQYPGIPVFITEAQTDEAGRVAWLTDLKNWITSKDASWVLGINLSQYTSRGQVQMGDRVGNLNWSVVNDPATKPIVRDIINGIK